MKLHFEDKLSHQLAAIEAVCDLFTGQEICRTEFTVTANVPPVRRAGENGEMFAVPEPVQFSLRLGESELGIGNRLTLLDDSLLENLHAVQLRGGLPPAERLASGDFSVEMETGTGKTYVSVITPRDVPVFKFADGR